MMATKSRKGPVPFEEQWKDHEGKNTFWLIFDGLCEIHCSPREIRAVLRCTKDELDGACERVKGMTFSEYRRARAEAGKATLRRLQWQSAQNGNVTMQIWLGKNLLGQADKIQAEHTQVDSRDVALARHAVEANPNLIDDIFGTH